MFFLFPFAKNEWIPRCLPKIEKELDTVIQIIIYSQDIQTKFRIEKCVMLIMKKGKRKQWKKYNNQLKKTSKYEKKKISDHRSKRKQKPSKYPNLVRQLKIYWTRSYNNKYNCWDCETWQRNWGNNKSEAELSLSRSQHFWDWLEYWEWSWRAKETCDQSDFTENCQLQLVWTFQKEYNNKKYILFLLIITSS